MLHGVFHVNFMLMLVRILLIWTPDILCVVSCLQCQVY